MTNAAPLSILHRLRAAEIETVERWFAPGARVLELGGGDGFQAQLLADRGCDVSSIDVAPRTNGKAANHSVGRYDGARIPFPDATFDVVFSSNVLEHIRHLPEILDEVSRVCRPGGYAVHLVPSTAWRFWTNATHFPWLASRALKWRKPASEQEPDLSHSIERNTRVQLLVKALGLAPHGEDGSAVSELYRFSRKRWRGVFEAKDLKVIYEGDNSLFYTGHVLLPDLPIATRRRLASALGAACHVFVVTRRGGGSSQNAR
jgi:SAM-dependent methyltransferase